MNLKSISTTNDTIIFTGYSFLEAMEILKDNKQYKFYTFKGTKYLNPGYEQGSESWFIQAPIKEPESKKDRDWET